jgi:phosphatidylserine/phosphatidylglycerophosphate/cardiolipin synthase-like enzyme
MNAVAISNNDIVYLHWHVENQIPGCLGFSVIRHDVKTDESEPLPAMVGFPSDVPTAQSSKAPKFKNTNVWPIQKFAWKDLFAEHGKTYWYEVVPMLGEPGSLKPDTPHAMRTNSVTLDGHYGSCAVFFNRGIISTQSVAHALSKSKSGLPSTTELTKKISNPKDPLRRRLEGELPDGVLELVNRAKKDKNGECYCALYELSDKQLVDGLVSLKDKLHLVLSNAGEDTEEGNGDGDSTNHASREELHETTDDMSDRMLKKGHIGHNKFVVYANHKGPQAVLSGSTNWTPTGLCAQSNNAIVIDSPDLASQYKKYWEDLQTDTKDADDDRAALQGPDFRSENKAARTAYPLQDKQERPAGTVQVWFSPNTKQKSVPSRKGKNGKPAKTSPTPPDLDEVFELIEGAKQGILFLAFIPGNPSIVTKLKQVYDAKRQAKQQFYLRGAATSPDPAGLFRVDLYHRSSKSDASVHGLPAPDDETKTKRARKKNGASSASVVSVAGIFKTFAFWEAEIYKIGHAVIHDKILVIDPFTDDSVVVTGSHNLGFRASYCNDENMLVIKQNRDVAYAYAAHVLDVYEHYRWRWMLQAPLRNAFTKEKAKNPKEKPAALWKHVVESVAPTTIDHAWQHLDPTDGWQDFYQKNKDFLAAEVNFWSPYGGVSQSGDRPEDPATDSDRGD